MWIGPSFGRCATIGSRCWSRRRGDSTATSSNRQQPRRFLRRPFGHDGKRPDAVCCHLRNTMFRPRAAETVHCRQSTRRCSRPKSIISTTASPSCFVRNGYRFLCTISSLMGELRTESVQNLSAFRLFTRSVILYRPGCHPSFSFHLRAFVWMY